MLEQSPRVILCQQCVCVCVQKREMLFYSLILSVSSSCPPTVLTARSRPELNREMRLSSHNSNPSAAHSAHFLLSFAFSSSFFCHSVHIYSTCFRTVQQPLTSLPVSTNWWSNYVLAVNNCKSHCGDQETASVWHLVKVAEEAGGMMVMEETEIMCAAYVKLQRHHHHEQHYDPPTTPSWKFC